MEILDELLVHESKQSLALIHDRYLHTQSRKHRPVFGADDASAHNEHLSRKLFEVQDVVAVKDGAPVELYIARPKGSRPNRDYEFLGALSNASGMGSDLNRMRIYEGGVPVQRVDVIPLQLMLDDIDLHLHRPIAPKSEIRHLNIGFDTISSPVNIALAKPGKEEHRLFKGFARYGARVDTYPSYDLSTIDNGDPLADLRRLHRCPLSGWSTPDHDQIIVIRMCLFSHVRPLLRSVSYCSPAPTSYLLKSQINRFQHTCASSIAGFILLITRSTLSPE
jgi:hypothetical protein